MIQGSRLSARLAAVLTAMVLVLFALGFGLNATGMVMPGGDSVVRKMLMASVLPMLCYLAAIWMIGRAFAALAGGGAVEPVLARLMKRLGLCLFLGGIARVLVEPMLMHFTVGIGRWPFANFDGAAITLGVVGLLLFLLARSIGDAAVMRAELEAIV